MNTKTRKTGARLGALLLSLCLMMGLMPMTAFADGTGPIKKTPTTSISMRPSKAARTARCMPSP